MKNTMRLLVAFLLLVFFITGCKKDEDVQLANPTAAFDSKTVEFGNSINALWNVPLDYEQVSVLLNGTEISTKFSGSYHIDEVTFKQVISILYYKSGQSDPSVIEISIEPTIPTISVGFSPQIIERGATTIFNWSITGSFDSISSNLSGVTGNFGSITIRPFTNDTVTVSTFTKGKMSNSVIAIVTVNEPPILTLADSVSSPFGSWKKYVLAFQDNPNAPWISHDIWECEKDDFLTFYQNPYVIVLNNGEIRCGNEPLTDQGAWSITGNVLKAGDNDYYDITLNSTNDTLIMISPHGGIGERVMEGYYRLVPNL